MEVKNLSAKTTSRVWPAGPDMPSLPFSMIIVGGNYSGKTNICRNIIQAFKKQIPTKRVIYVAGSINDTVREMSEREHVKVLDTFYPEQNSKRPIDILSMIFAAQKATKPKERKPVLVVIDDMTHDALFNRQRGPVQQLLGNGRNYGISTVITAHDYKKVPKFARTISNYRVFFGASGRHAEEIVDDLQSSYITDTKNLMKLFKKATEKPYNFLYYNVLDAKYYHNFTNLMLTHPHDTEAWVEETMRPYSDY